MKHPIPAEALKESIAIVGRRGSGKSYAAKGAVELLLRDQARVCIIDPTGVWYGLRSSASGKDAAFPVVVFGGDHGDVAIGDTSGAALADMLAGQNLPAIVDVSEFSRGGMVRFMGAFLDALYRSNRNPLTLVVDEADIFAPQRPEPETAGMLGRMEQIVRRGRTRGFRPWLITQRPASLNKNVLSQANTLIAMQLTAPQDRDAIGAWIEGQAEREEGKAILAALPKLQKGEGFVWSPAHDVLERVKFPKITTFDSSRSPEEGEALPQLTLATVDLSGIEASLREVEKIAADNDPGLLRKRIAELERNVDELKRDAGPHIDPGMLAHEYARGYAACAANLQSIKEMVVRARGTIDGIDASISAIAAALEAPVPPPRELAATKAASRDDWIPLKHSSQFNASRELVKSGTNGALSKAERLILTALAQYPSGRTKQQVAILTGYAVNGGGFSNAVSSLRTKGYLEGESSRLVITPCGIAALGAFDPLPRGRELLDYWFRQLSKAERKALESLAEVYPRTLSKSQLAARAGYEANGGGFNNALSRLRTLELIAGRAELKASEALFD